MKRLKPPNATDAIDEDLLLTVSAELAEAVDSICLKHGLSDDQVTAAMGLMLATNYAAVDPRHRKWLSEVLLDDDCAREIAAGQDATGL